MSTRLGTDPQSWTADTWPIACAMLPFGSPTAHDAPADEWAAQVEQVADLGFTDVDPTDNWVRVADLSDARLAEFRSVLADHGLGIPAISTSRRSIIDATRGDEYLAYSHRLLDVAAKLDVPIVSFGLFQDLTPQQQAATWFWHVTGHVDPSDPQTRATAAARFRELAQHAADNGQQISLEMYEDTYIGTCDSAVEFLAEIDHPACGLNPDLGNFIRLHRPIEPVPDMLDKVLPHTNFWHVKNYLRDEDVATGSYTTFPLPLEMGFINYRSAIRQSLELGFRGPFLTEHYGSDGLGVCARNREYIRSVLATAL